MACAASIWNWAISNFNPILFMPFKTDFGRGTENKQKKSKLGHPNVHISANTCLGDFKLGRYLGVINSRIFGDFFFTKMPPYRLN